MFINNKYIKDYDSRLLEFENILINKLSIYINETLKDNYNNENKIVNSDIYNVSLSSIKNWYKENSLKTYKLVYSKKDRNNILAKYVNTFNKCQEYYFYCINKTIDSSQLKCNGLSKIKKLVRTNSDIFKNLSFIEKSLLVYFKVNIHNELTWEQYKVKSNNFSDYEYLNNLNCINNKQEILKYIFGIVINDLKKFHKKEFKKMLHEIIGMNNEVTWYDAQNMLQEDERYQCLIEKDREELFNIYIESLFSKIELDFIIFINNSNFITSESNIDNTYEFDNILSKLNKDIRGKRMMKYPERRDKLIKKRIKELKHINNLQSKNRNKYY